MEEENSKKEEKKQEKKIEDQKRVSKPKTGIEKLKEIGLKKVSNKTFINLENLTYLLDKDFDKLHKTKALGFIQILERDFDVDLRELRAEYLTYQNGPKHSSNSKRSKHKKVTDDSELATEQRVTINERRELNPEREDRGSIKIGPYLLLLLAGILGYYLFKSATKDDNTLDMQDLNIVQNTKPAQNSLIENAIKSDTKADDTEVVDEEDLDLNKAVHDMLKGVDINDSTIEAVTSTGQTEGVEVKKEESKDEQNSSAKIQDDSKTDTKNIESKDQIKEAVIPNSNTKEDETKSIPTLANIESEKKSQEQKAKDTQNDKKEAKKEEAKKPNVAKKAVAKKGLYIKPIQKAWVGVIYLDDYSKKDFLIRGKLKLNPNRDQLILLGHNKFEIYNHGKKLPFNSTKKVRFLYQGGELIEIDPQEYKDRSAGVRW